ncbi:uncharacterized protein LOC131685151 [Topomyia yanbarensis]|uniref:uncharacterized protein LOC131685151 n=1 Tax=Topomyia yanbarensis TaxID=2498891 RepID=UPI00273C31CA|nr:uncharacterized protein LOC131685151 [Topomyia yanbarensis]
MSHYPNQGHFPHGQPLPHNPHEGPISHTVFPPDMNPNYPHRPLPDPTTGHYYPPGGVHPPGHYPPPHLMPPSLDDPHYPQYPPGHYPPGHYPPGVIYPPGHYPPHYPIHQQAVAYGGSNPRKTEEKK